MLSTLKINVALKSLVLKMTAMLVARITDLQCALRAVGTKRLGGHCVLKWGFMLTFPGKQDATLK